MAELTTPTVELKEGDKAPAFSTEATDGTHISLSDFAGKKNVVLYFYPEDMTSGCTVEAHHFRDDKALYDAANTVVLGVSMDPKEMHQQFTEKDSLNFPLLVDVTGKITGDYGVPASENRYPKRWTFLIGKDGKIAKVYHKVDPRVHSQELLKDIAELNAKH
jgi:peroxiredoxin Q/BCP